METTPKFSVEKMTIKSLFRLWCGSDNSLEWTSPFIHPAFMNPWWKHFGKNESLLILGIKENNAISVIAPLMQQSGCVRFIGDPEVCDYHDEIAIRENARFVLTSLLNYLKGEPITKVHLGLVRPDSFVYKNIHYSADAAGVKVVSQKAGIFYELKLSDTWETFLSRFSGKQRHEIRRKIRRLNDAGKINFRCIWLQEDIDMAMAKETAKAGILKLFFLDIDDCPAASVLCFDLGDRLYLYNNGYDIRYQKLGVGVLSKFFSIKAAIEGGKKIYDFLKGDEAYKERMGGSPVPLYNFEVSF